MSDPPSNTSFLFSLYVLTKDMEPIFLIHKWDSEVKARSSEVWVTNDSHGQSTPGRMLLLDCHNFEYDSESRHPSDGFADYLICFFVDRKNDSRIIPKHQS